MPIFRERLVLLPFPAFCRLILCAVGLTVVSIGLSTECYAGADNDSGHANAFSRPMEGLTDLEGGAFLAGRRLFRLEWTASASPDPRAKGSKGLGPLFNAQSCADCHPKNGRGYPAHQNRASRGVVVRIATKVPPIGSEHLDYGRQINDHAIPGFVFEGRPTIDYVTKDGMFSDATKFALRQPIVGLDQLGLGPINHRFGLSLRVAPSVAGLGLLEAVPVDEILAHADPADKDKDGISGHANIVPLMNAGGKTTTGLGRFGWKAEIATIRDQILSALAQDIGVSSREQPYGPCSPSQSHCQTSERKGWPEIDAGRVNELATYIKFLSPPTVGGRLSDRRGAVLFERARCHLCHRPSLNTRLVLLDGSTKSFEIYPYTDLLLHDMGSDLADTVSAHRASGREWRTPPLWGIGAIPHVNGHQYLLHDGRARGVLEAILWHGGEAKASRDAVLNMTRDERHALIVFVNNL